MSAPLRIGLRSGRIACGTRLAARCALLLALSCAAVTPCRAATSLRYSSDQRGDFVLFGNTLGYDCGPDIPRPIIGAVAADCGLNTSDTAMDVYFRAEDQGAAAALVTGPSQARSTAVLVLPAGARVTYARLYWGSQVRAEQPPSPFALLERPGVPAVPLAADGTRTQSGAPIRRPELTYYQHTSDVTALVQRLGAGPYRLSGAAGLDLGNVDDAVLFAAWSVVVFYNLATEPPRNLTLFDGLELVAPGSDASTTLSGFLVPGLATRSRLGIIAYEGDQSSVGDALLFGGAPLSDAQNPSNNFFNASRSRLGGSLSPPGELPQLSGAAGSMIGLDLDDVDVTPLLNPGQRSIDIRATSQEDVFFIGALVTSLSTTLAGLLTEKTWANVTLPGEARLRPGDTVAFTLRVRHDQSGDEAVSQVVLQDALPAELEYVPGTLAIVDGPGAGPRSDASGDDEAEYDATLRTVRFRLGQGASAQGGGRLARGDAAVSVRFLARVPESVRGTLSNVAVASGAPERGGISNDYPSSTLVLQLCDPRLADCGAITRFGGGGPPQGCAATRPPGARASREALPLPALLLGALWILVARRRRGTR